MVSSLQADTLSFLLTTNYIKKLSGIVKIWIQEPR